MSFTIHQGDCLEVLRTLPDNSVDSIVTDPPYGLSFMVKRWDYDVPSVEVWAECLRVLKPGGHLLAFAGTRTQHRMAVRIEDAGFEIRDMIAWVYGSGFPKSHNGEWGGTALKPSLEPITMARKPLSGTVAQNWREHGTGALNIDRCRVGTDDTRQASYRMTSKGIAGGGFASSAMDYSRNGTLAGSACGRWPANLIHDGSEEVMAAFPQAKGQQGAVTGDEPSSKTNAVYGQFNGRPATEPRGDTGSAARFFYCAKASKSDREEGLESAALKPLAYGNQAQAEVKRGNIEHAGESGMNTVKMRANHHPTVKPTDLMAYLCRLVTPPGGVVLDPFMGSGSTGKAAVLQGFSFIGIERESEYVEIARARITAAKSAREEATRQPDMFSHDLGGSIPAPSVTEDEEAA